MLMMSKLRLGLLAVEIVGRITPAVLDVVEERTGVPPAVMTELVKAKLQEQQTTFTRVSQKTVSLFIDAIGSLLSDLES